MLKPLQNTESFQRLVKRVQSQSVVECRFPQSSEIAEILAAEPQVAAVSCEVADGRVNYSGKLVLTIVYSDEGGKLCRMQKGAEFSHYSDDDGLAPAQNGVCLLSCDKLSTRRDGSSFVISAVITADICVYARAERTYLTDAEGAFIKSGEINFCSLVTFSGESEVEDDFEADSLVDVLIPSAKAVVLSAVCGTGDVDVSGEIYLSLFAMRQQSPVCIERVIPFRTTVPCDDASAGIKAEATAEISDLNVTANVNEDRGKCDLNVVCSLTVNGRFAVTHSAGAAVDAFSGTNELDLTVATERVTVCGDVKVYSERVSGLAAAKSRLGYDCAFCAAALSRAEASYNADTGCAEGAASCRLIYIQNGEIKSTEIELPFAVALNGVAEEGQSVALDIAVGGMAVRLKAEGEAEAEAALKICAAVTGQRECTYVSNAEEGAELIPNDCAVSVFMPAAGDGLWDVAKKLKKSPSDVAACNPELNFPLTGRERILIYRAKNA